VVFTEPYEGVRVSDHFGVMTEVAIEGESLNSGSLSAQ
jgi:hypothetical protein